MNDQQIDQAVDDLLTQIATRHIAKMEQSFESNLPPYDSTWQDPASNIAKDDYRTLEQVANDKAAEAYDRAKKAVREIK